MEIFLEKGVKKGWEKLEIQCRQEGTMNSDGPGFTSELKSQLQSMAQDWEWICEVERVRGADLLTPVKTYVCARNKTSGFQTIPIYVNELSGDPEKTKQTARFILQVLMIKPGAANKSASSNSPALLVTL
jgi:hypothetical protein